jgi:hypothetical protein
MNLARLALILFGVVFFTLWLSGCAQTTILPEGNGQYNAVASGVTRSDTLNQAMQKATNQCNLLHKHVVTIGAPSYAMNNNIQNAQKNGSISQATLLMLNPENCHVSLRFKCVS